MLRSGTKAATTYRIKNANHFLTDLRNFYSSPILRPRRRFLLFLSENRRKNSKFQQPLTPKFKLKNLISEQAQMKQMSKSPIRLFSKDFPRYVLAFTFSGA